VSLLQENDHEYKLRPATPSEIIEMYDELDEVLNDFAHAAISAREGNNRQPNDYADVTRGMRLTAFDVDVLNEHGIRYNLMDREDFEITLRLLILGLPNRVLFKYATNQKGSNSEGGLCGSPGREYEAIKKNVLELKSLFPDFIRVVKKQTKTSWGGKERYDVVCYWKKAFASSQK
jgi:hypothetical protein